MQDIIGTTDVSSQGKHWLSIADLMAGLMMVFLFVSIVYMRQQEQTIVKVDDLAQEARNSQLIIQKAIEREFREDWKALNAKFDAKTLSISFQTRGNFPSQSAELSTQFKVALDAFFTRYLRVLQPYKGNIDEIQIQGHTSPEWEGAANPDDAFFLNLDLSQARARNVFKYVYSQLPMSQRHWVTPKLGSAGLSSSRPILKHNGRPDREASRRVEVKIKTRFGGKMLEFLLERTE